MDENGKVLGRHKGLIRYTTGQRKGLGLALPAPLYVKEKDIEHNRVVLCPESGLYTKTVFANNFNFVSGSDFSEPTKGDRKTQIQGKGGCRHGRGFG